MSLGKQLLVIALLLLMIPWVGVEYIREVEGLLQKRQASEVQNIARLMRNVMSREPSMIEALSQLRGQDDVFYAYDIEGDVLLDGYDSEWSDQLKVLEVDFGSVHSDGSEERSYYRIAATTTDLFIFLHIEDDEVNYHEVSDNRLKLSDFVVLKIVDSNNTETKYALTTSAPGSIVTRRLNSGVGVRDHRVAGVWQESEGGYNIEVSIPLRKISALGIDIVDRDKRHSPQLSGVRQKTNMGNTVTSLSVKSLLVSDSALQNKLDHLLSPYHRLRIFSDRGWRVAKEHVQQDSHVFEDMDVEQGDSIIMSAWSYWSTRLFRLLIAADVDDQPDLSWFASTQIPGPVIEGVQRNSPSSDNGSLFWEHNEEEARVVAFLPIFSSSRQDNKAIGFLALERTTGSILSLADDALGRFLNYGLVVLLLTYAVLFFFAFQLSFRIRRLNVAASNIIDDDGSIRRNFYAARYHIDELSELSQSFYEMQLRLNEYTEYLRSLASKMSHELKTPIAIAKTSIENIGSSASPEEIRTYVNRANEGMTRLNHIINALSAASKVEQVIAQGDKERFDLSALMRELVHSYQELHPQVNIISDIPISPCEFEGCPELIAQLLDKLIDNAVGFIPSGGRLWLLMVESKKNVQISVVNEGSRLPDHMSSQLFDSMVSVRSHTNEGTHLGLGLYIVRLITQFHNGSVQAKNLDNADGVEGVAINLQLPKN